MTSMTTIAAVWDAIYASSGMLMLLVLASFGIVCTYFFKGIQITSLKESIRLLFHKKGGSGRNSISSVQAFCISMGERIGVGNITGVAVAITVGGPGAIFWMWIFGILVSVISFIETTIAQIYKVKGTSGEVPHGGVAYYIKNSLGRPYLAAFIAGFYIISFGYIACGLQVNTVASAVSNAFSVDPLVITAIITILCGYLVFGGALRVAKVSNAVVPVMAAAYLLFAGYIMFLNLNALPGIFSSIISSAFSFQAGIIGFMTAVIVGAQRVLVATCSGTGDTTYMSSLANVSHPVEQGLVQSLGVLIDSLIICTASAMLILCCPDYTSLTSEGIQLVQDAVSITIGPSAIYAIAVLIFVFGITSVISCSTLGEMNLRILTDSPKIMALFKWSLVAVLFIFGAAKLYTVVSLVDVFLSSLAVINVVCLCFLAKYALAALKDYMEQKDAGIETPVFSSTKLGLKGADFWADKINE